jgi:hypothetical protein
MQLFEPRWKLFDLYGAEQSWDTVQAHNVLWHDRKERHQRGGNGRVGSVSRGIALTEAGRAYLAALRESRG